jgi:uncharacterized membrane protein YhaH (DUF805 family)
MFSTLRRPFQGGLLGELFSFKGRMSSQRYSKLIFYSLGIMVAPMFAAIVSGAIIGALVGPDFIRNSPVISGVLTTIVVVGLFFGGWSRSAIETKRRHDLGRPSWMPLWTWTLFRKGTPGHNKYGMQTSDSSEPNTLWKSGSRYHDEED